MNQKIYDSEIKVMDFIWERGPVSAKELSRMAAESIGWNKNTTYTIIKKLVAKGFIRRDEPGFICTALVTREEIGRSETRSLVDKLYGGSRKALFSALLEDDGLTEEELEELRAMIERR